MDIAHDKENGLRIRNQITWLVKKYSPGGNILGTKVWIIFQITGDPRDCEFSNPLKLKTSPEV